MTNLVILGAKKDLEGSDLPDLRPQDLAANTHDWTAEFLAKHEAFLLKENKSVREKSPTLFGSLLRQFGILWIASGIIFLISIASMVGIPLVLQQVIDLTVFRSQVPDQYWDSVAIPDSFPGFPLYTKSNWNLACLLLALKVISTLFGRMHDMITKRIAFQIRTILISAIVKKSLTISNTKSTEFSKGYVLNLINVDSESISLVAEQLHQVWGVPLQIIAAIALLSVIIGSSIGAGIGALFASLLLLGGVVPVLMGTSIPKMVVLNDTRVRIIREVLDGIRLIKIRSLEHDFTSQIVKVRTEQLAWLRMVLFGVVCFVVVGQLAASIMPVATLTLYAVRGNAMAASVVFPASALFNMLVNPLILLPNVLNSLVTATIAWKRVYKFLTAPNRETTPEESSTDIAIDFKNASFNWPQTEPSNSKEKEDRKGFTVADTSKKSPAKGSETAAVPAVADEEEIAPRTIIEDLNVTIKKGEFVAIVGQVGSGKSSLLSSILGELHKSSGSVTTNGSIAYCTQQPWIQTGTLQENITFGTPHDATRLAHAVKCTSFEIDLAQMPSGLQTVLGEKGTSVSGGQKTRISLARAVYSDAEIYLFDDPLSSLDAKVSRAVFTDCFKTALKGKTILLATHNHDVLKNVDRILFLLGDGLVLEGGFDELMKIKEFKEFATTVDDTKEGSGSSAAVVGASVHRANTADAGPDPLSVIAVEESEIGNVKWSTYLRYIQASGGWSRMFLLALSIVLFQATGVLSNQWLSWWTESKFSGHDVYFWTLWYNLLAWMGVVFLVVMNLIILGGIMSSTRSFHETAVAGVLNAPIWWFESQQIGRIMNRFTKDMAAIDNRLLPLVFQFIAGIGGLLSILVVLAINAPWLLIGVIPLTALYLYVLHYYRSTMRQLKRLESTQRSPLYSHVSESLEGVSTILAFKKQEYFRNVTYELLDHSNSPLFFKFGAELWVMLRLELLSSILIFVLAALSTNQNIISASNIGVALLYTNSMTALMNLILQSAANMETEMVCVERLVEYAEKLPVEGVARLPNDPGCKEWPKSGSIELEKVSAFYKSKPETPVLKEIDLRIQSGEKVCVVGRTGSGKSTMISVLLRFVSMKGVAKIDGRDINSIGLRTLRDTMEVIPQDIYLFSGTMRTTLDRGNQFTDSQLWECLELVGMKTFVSNLDGKLDTPITNGGNNLSLGQRQLLYFARILLLKPKILLMDEATSSVDPETETTLRRIIKEQFLGTTIVAVLHRLQTSVLDDFDKVLVMDQGNVAEFDSPRVLLERNGSMFASLYNSRSSDE
ncbi:UNVERIFIED_CONTAM: ATP-binding cassette sub- C member 8 [Siphonaria sp. JEL0065]|nr:ATP-binding cassette sub- C member 8 [Siphonaria sp. JEL0065]